MVAATTDDDDNGAFEPEKEDEDVSVTDFLTLMREQGYPEVHHCAHRIVSF
jgi:hypothetical protein